MHHIVDEEQIILRPRKSKMILLAFVSLLFVAVGVWTIEKDSWKIWSGIVFFSICFLVAFMQLLPGSSKLTLTRDGFAITSLFKSHFTKWEDVKSFEEGNIGPNKSVMFDYIDGHEKHTTGKGIAKHLSRFHGGLPDTYGLTTSELARLLNDWKDRKQYGT